jgi:co-chaperonin GroES (HSP10)
MSNVPVTVLQIPEATTIEDFPFKPHAGIVVIEPYEHTKTEGGLFLAKVDDAYVRGVVVAFGPGQMHNGLLVPNGVELGQFVRMAKKGAGEIAIEGKKYFAVAGMQILGHEDSIPVGWSSAHTSDPAGDMIRNAILNPGRVPHKH